MDVKKKITYVFFGLLIIVPVVAFGVMYWLNKNYIPLPYYGTKEKVVQADGSIKEEPFTVSSFGFTNQDNKPLTGDFIKNKIWVADYFFTKCNSICPKMTTHLQNVQEAFVDDDNVKILSFTVDPERDDPATLKAYASMFQANTNQWQFATGDKKELYAFARKGLFIVATDGDGGDGDFIHSENLVLIDRNNHIRGYYDGTSDAQVNQLIKDIQRLKKEK